MTSVTITEQETGHFYVKGDLTFTTIDKKLIKTMPFSNSVASMFIDLKDVANADSAGLALLLEWIKYAHQQGSALQLVNVPNQLLTLAKLSGLNETLMALIA